MYVWIRYIQGRLRFESQFMASDCATVGGGESAPGNGGGIFNGETGDIVFKGEMEMTDCGTFVSARFDASRRGKTLWTLPATNVEACTVAGIGSRSACYVAPDLSCETEGAEQNCAEYTAVKHQRYLPPHA